MYRLLIEQEKAPDAWFRWKSPLMWEENMQILADFMKCDRNDITFVANATTGCNAVLKSVYFEAEDQILIHNYTYPSVKNACRAALSKTGGKVVELFIPLDIDSKERLIHLYREAILEHPNIRLVVLDWIVGQSAVKMPVTELITLCKEHDKLVLLDGAHALGQLHVDVEKLGVDFFVGNLHKWLFTQRGCAVLYVDKKHQQYIESAVTGNIYGANKWHEQFRLVGTLDNTNFYNVYKAIEFFHSLGGQVAVNSYCGKLVTEAAAMLAKAWNTSTSPVCEDLRAPHMRLVQIPYISKVSTIPKSEHEIEAMEMPQVVRILHDQYNISVSGLPLQGKNYIRLSASVYNSLEDYKLLKDAILDMARTG